MCGICGIIGSQATEAAAREDIVWRMMASLAHRGPDGEGLESGGGFTLGHRRLAVIDLERGAQPMISGDGTVMISYNGELYNFLELRQALVQEGHTFRTFSDTEVVLETLAVYGKTGLERLNGMFAFAAVNQVSGEWILARDPFGIKPLYYVETADGIVFASEIKALFEHPGVRPQLDWLGLEDYLTFQFCLNDRTLFAGVHEVEPGCYLTGRGAWIEGCTRYWDTNYVVDEHHTEQYFRDRLLHLLEDSVRLQIRSDVPLGAYLSGGLDSSAVAIMAAEHLSAGIPVFNGRFAEGPQYDESHYARAVADEIGGAYYEIVPSAADFVELLPKLVYQMDEPAAGPGLFPQYMVSRTAAEHVKVVLGGQGGDELFGGYARYLAGYLEQALKGAIFESQEEGQHLVTLGSIIPNLPLLKSYTPLLQEFLRDGLFEPMDARYFRLVDRSPDAARILSADAWARIDHARIFAEFQGIFNHPDTKSYFNKMTHFDQKTLLPALLQVEDRVSMAVSLESRVPLLDTRVADLVTTMPPNMKFQGGKTKHVFHETVKTLVPAAVHQRKDKMGFPVPLKEWLADGPVRSFVGDVLLSRASRERGIYNADALKELAAGQRSVRQLWGALCLELWHQTFIDR